MEIYKFIPIVISIFSLGVSIYSYRKIYHLNLDVRNLNLRRARSEQFDEYAKLLNSEYWKLKDDLSKLSDRLCDTNICIGNILDKYDSRKSYSPKGYSKHLRHLYVDLHRGISNLFKNELSCKSAQNIYGQLAIFKYSDPSLGPMQASPWWKNIFVSNRNGQPTNVYEFKESKKFLAPFVELSDAIEPSDSASLYNEFVDACKGLNKLLKQLEPKYRESYDVLDSGTTRNHLQEFKLWECPPLYSKYTRYKCLMDFISQSRLGTLKNVEEAPFSALAEIVYYGANINMIDELLCDTVFSLSE